MLRFATCVACCTTPHGAAQSPTLARVLEPVRAHLGGQAALAADFVVDAVVHTTPPRTLRTFVRREPFAIRQETATAAGTEVHVSDGRHAWRLRAGKGEMLAGAAARLLLEAACVD